MHLATFRLHNGAVPGEQDEIKMLEDPAYRAQQEGLALRERERIRNSNDGRAIGHMYYDKVNQRLIQILFSMECALFDEGQIIGIARYNPKTQKEKIELFPTRQ